MLYNLALTVESVDKYLTELLSSTFVCRMFVKPFKVGLTEPVLRFTEQYLPAIQGERF